jgi:hypothetical protein
MWAFESLLASVTTPVGASGSEEQDVLFPSLKGVPVPAGRVGRGDVVCGEIFWTVGGSAANKRLRVLAGQAVLVDITRTKQTPAQIRTSFWLMGEPDSQRKVVRVRTTGPEGTVVDLPEGAAVTLDVLKPWTLRIVLGGRENDLSLQRAYVWTSVGVM